MRTESLTQVHVGGLLPVGVGDVLVDGIQDLLLHLADGVAVQHLHLDLGALLVLGVDAVHHLETHKTTPYRLPGVDIRGSQAAEMTERKQQRKFK